MKRELQKKASHRRAKVVHISTGIAFAACMGFFAQTSSADDQATLADPTVVSSISTTVTPPTAETEAVESFETYRVKTSPLRSDTLAFHVMSSDLRQAYRLELPAIEGMSFNMVCRDAERTRIACGSRARINLTNFLVHKELTCRYLTSQKTGPKLQSCSVGDSDLGEWMVRNGVARPAAGQYAEALADARTARRGMWSDVEFSESKMAVKN